MANRKGACQTIGSQNYQPSTLKTINLLSLLVTAPLTKPRKGSAIQLIITAQTNPALEN
jgi:hypothetical protein